MASKEKLQVLIDAEREAAGILSQAEKRASEIAAKAGAKADELRKEFQESIAKKRRDIGEALKAEDARVRDESSKRVESALAALAESVSARRGEAVDAVVEAVRG
jgi:cell division septum initiation protein DivIVA